MPLPFSPPSRWGTDAMPELVVVKVGGSLYDLPDLGPRLRGWLDTDPRAGPPASVILVPGGGPTTDVIRNLDCWHGLRQEASHWLALRALTLNAHFLAALMQSTVVEGPQPLGPRVQVLDAFAFLRDDEWRHARATIQHSWDATSDSVAARFAVAMHARRLILLKSRTVQNAKADWRTVDRSGFVDPLVASVLREATHDLEVDVVNLREWQVRIDG
jgi:aspartokinase-like uncharacterized kinase